MKQYNWIKAKNAEGDEIFVRQCDFGSKMWFDGRGRPYDISELDFTQCLDEPKIFNLEEFEKHNKEINQQYQESQAMYMEMLSKMDANSIADHKAKIDEREYWRKLRGEIFASLRKDYHSDLDALNQTEYVVNRLYKQNQEFFKDK